MEENIYSRYTTLLARYNQVLQGRGRLVALSHWLMTYASEGVALFDRDGLMVANRQFSRLCDSAGRVAVLPGGDAAGIVGGPLLHDAIVALAGDLRARPPAEARRVRFGVRGGAIYEAEARVLLQEGQVAVVLRDVSESEALRREREEGKRRDEFLSMLAHELRNPLAPILASAESILQHCLDPRVQREAERIARQVRHQARLVDDLLDTARVRRGKITLKRGAVDLRAVAQEAASSTAPLRGGRVALHLALPEAPVWVNGDPTRLVQCAVNLLVNAAKFTPHGDNWLEVEAGRDVAWLRVRDNGIGMEAGMLDKAFDVFTQGEQGLDRVQGGLGLGLALVRSLMELHHGGVRAASAGPGEGAEFTLWLPLAAAPEAEAAQPVPAEGSPRPASTVLVVEDNPDIRDCLCELLGDAGHRVFCAADGGEALAVAQREHPDVVVSDIGLPVLDGFTLAERLRPMLPGARLIALSGYSRGEDRERARRAGYNDYLVKPVEAGTLLASVSASPPHMGSAAG